MNQLSVSVSEAVKVTMAMPFRVTDSEIYVKFCSAPREAADRIRSRTDVV